MEQINGTIEKEEIKNIKHLITTAYNKGFSEGAKATRLRIADLLNRLSEEIKTYPEPAKGGTQNEKK